MPIAQDLIIAEIDQRALDFTQDAVLSLGGNAPAMLEETGAKRWAKCGRGKVSYTTISGYYPDGKYFRRVTVSNFKTTLSFNSNKIYDDVVKNLRAGNQRHTVRPITLNTLPQIDKAKLLALAADQDLWNDGVKQLPYLHPYLAKKGLPSIANDSTRYVEKAANRYSAFPTIDIMVKIVDIDGNLQSFQMIDEQGHKLFTGAKKGNFIILGELPTKSLPKVYVVEGLATGFSVRLANPNSLVICALDAGNIEPVVSSLRTKYGSPSKCEIIIVADNDQWKAQQINPATGRPIGNTGLSKASTTALRHRCLIVIPNFDGLNVSNEPTDIDDLRQLAGLDEVKRQLALVGRPDPQHAISQESLEIERQRNREQFRGHKVIAINERFLPKDVPDIDDGNVRNISELILATYMAVTLTKRVVTIMRSPIGSGKTTAAKEVLRLSPNESTLFISPLSDLAGGQAQVLGIENYQDYQGQISGDGSARINELQRLSICVDSIVKLIDKDGKLIRPWHIIFLDEVEYIIRRLTSSMERKAEVLLALKQLLQQDNCRIIVMDAFISSVTMDLLKQWMPKDKFLVLLNEYEVGQNREVILYVHQGSINAKAIEAVKNGQTAFIVTNSAKGARKLYKQIKETTGKRGLYIAANNNGDPKVRAFFANPNSEVLNYDFIVCSPSVTSGISIDEDYFDFVAGIFTHRVNTPMDALQALGRVRNAKKLHVYISPVKRTLIVDPKEITAKWTETHAYDNQLLKLDDFDNEEMLDIAKDYKRIVVKVTTEANYSKQDYLSRFIKLCLLDGYKVRNASDDISKDTSKFLLDGATELEATEYVENRVAAPVLSDDEKTTLKDKCYRRPLADNEALSKAEILEFYNVDTSSSDEVVRQLIIDDNRGKTRHQIRNVELALSTDDQIRDLREQEIKNGITLAPDKRAFATEREVFQQVLTIAGINTELMQDGSKYNAEILLETFVPYILSQYLILTGALGRLPKPDAIKSDPIRALGTLLRKLGLSHNRQGDNAKGEYQVDTSKLATMRNHILRRGKVLLKHAQTDETRPKQTDSAYISYIQHLSINQTSINKTNGGTDNGS